MPKVKLYIATSLDGFIAERDGGVGWLFTDGDYGYAAFFESVEALIMGRHTYEQVLGFGEWPYEEKPAYVFARSAPGGEHPHVGFVSSDAGTFVEELRRRSTKDIWLVGGAALVSTFRKLGLIDEYILSVHPVLLGDGIPCSSVHCRGKGCGYEKCARSRAGSCSYATWSSESVNRSRATSGFRHPVYTADGTAPDQPDEVRRQHGTLYLAPRQ